MASHNRHGRLSRSCFGDWPRWSGQMPEQTGVWMERHLGSVGRLDCRRHSRTPRSEYASDGGAARFLGRRRCQRLGGLCHIRRCFDPVKSTPKLRLEFNHASGDSNPSDGKHGTFDVLYPTAHDKYGMADQVGWKNVKQRPIACIAPADLFWYAMRPGARERILARSWMCKPYGCFIASAACRRTRPHVRGRVVKATMRWRMACSS